MCTWPNGIRLAFEPQELACVRFSPQGGKLGVTNVTDMFSSVFELLTMPCVCAHIPREVSSALLMLLMCFQVHSNHSQCPACVHACLARSFIHGKFITDGFAGFLELPTWPWTCTQTLSMPGQLGSIVPVHSTAARRPN